MFKCQKTVLLQIDEANEVTDSVSEKGKSINCVICCCSSGFVATKHCPLSLRSIDIDAFRKVIHCL